MPFHELGLTVRMRAAMSEALHERRAGLVLVAGAARGGRSTTMAGLVFEFSPYPTSPSDPTAGRRMRGPRLARATIIEEVNDEYGAHAVAERLERGECIFATTIASTAIDALASLVRHGIGAELLRNRLRGCLYQRLVSRPCPRCEVPVWAATRIGAEFSLLARSLALDEYEGDVSFVHCRGCEHCRQTGLVPRIGIFEWLGPVCLSHLPASATAEQFESTLNRERSRLTELFGAGAFIGIEEDLQDKVLARSISIGEAARFVESRTTA